MGRVLGVDLGTVRVGLAVSDPLGSTAQPLDVIEAGDVGPILQIVRDMNVEEIVVGLPVGMDGTEGPAAKAARVYADRLHVETGLPVTLWDERLSSVEAERAMAAQGADGRARRGKVDKVAAAIVLQGFLESRRT